MKRSLCGSVLFAALALGALLAGGCYERVVRAEGTGAQTHKVEPRYQADYAVDDWIFGQRETKPRKP